MEECHLHLLIAVLCLCEEHQAALLITPVHSLNESAAFQNAVVVPLHFEHAPVLLDVNRGKSLLIPPLLCLTSIMLSDGFTLTLSIDSRSR